MKIMVVSKDVSNLDINKPISFISLYITIIWVITINLQKIQASEYCYFYLCSLRLILGILTIFLVVSVIYQSNNKFIHTIFLKLLLVYTTLVIIFWYYNLPLSLTDATHYFIYDRLKYYGLTLTFIIFIFVSIEHLRNYKGKSRKLSFGRDFLKALSKDSKNRYISYDSYSPKKDSEIVIKWIAIAIILIFLSIIILFLPSMLSYLSPRLYDIYTVTCSVKV